MKKSSSTKAESTARTIASLSKAKDLFYETAIRLDQSNKDGKLIFSTASASALYKNLSIVMGYLIEAEIDKE